MSQYQTGTVTLQSGKQCVSGEGTAWLANASVGDLLKKRSENAFYTIGAVTSNTTMDLTANYVGTTCSGELYTITKDFTDNYNAPEIYTGDRDWAYHVTYAFRIFDTEIAAASTLTVTDHTTETTVVLDYDDFDEVHLFQNTSACIVTLPDVDTTDVGKWMELRKKGSGDLTINVGGSGEYIMTTSGRCVANTNISPTFEYINLFVESASHWSCRGMYGVWSVSGELAT